MKRNHSKIYYRKIVDKFSDAMLKELIANDDKGGRNDEKEGWLTMTDKENVSEIYYHTGKLQAALKAGDLNLIKELSADIANGALMVYDKYSPLITL